MESAVPYPDYPSFPISSYMCLKILSCNAHLAWPFSEAYIDMIPLQNNQGDVLFFPLHTLIPKAYSFLLSETNDLTGVRIANMESVNEEQKAAFDCLIKFLHSKLKQFQHKHFLFLCMLVRLKIIMEENMHKASSNCMHRTSRRAPFILWIGVS